MQEACFCGRTGAVEDREPVVTEDGRRALRCSNEDCAHLEYLDWLSEDARHLAFEEAERLHRRRSRWPVATPAA